MKISPYVKYQKAPYRYSELYYRWRKARVAGDDKLADRLMLEHMKVFQDVR